MPVERDGFIWSRAVRTPPTPRKNAALDHVSRPGNTTQRWTDPAGPKDTPHAKEEFVPWSWAETRLQDANTYWFSTISPDGLPHTIPAWGVWHENALYFGSHTDTRWNRLLLANSSVSVHLEKGAEVLTLEGTVRMTGSIAEPLASQLGAEYVRKYGGDPATDYFASHGCWVLYPRVAHGWRSFPKTVTRWRFPAAS